MVWVALFNSQGGFLGYLHLLTLPATSRDDYRCMPHGMLSLESVVQISNNLHRGSVSGQVEGYQWCRQAADHAGPVPTSRE
jgi:hypothetical protein